MLLNKCRLQLELALELCLSVQRAVEEVLVSGTELEGREGALLASLLLLGGQLAVLLGSSTMARLEELLAWGERELCPVTGGETGQHQSRAQVRGLSCPPNVSPPPGESCPVRAAEPGQSRSLVSSHWDRGPRVHRETGQSSQ